MATSETAQSFQSSTTDSVPRNRLKRVIRTRRREPACRPQPGRNDSLINTNCRKANGLSDRHPHIEGPKSESNSVRNSLNSRSQADPRGFNTTSRPAGKRERDVRIISRTLLFIRFLSCAGPSLRGVVSPKRLCSRPFAIIKTTKEREVFFAPLL